MTVNLGAPRFFIALIPPKDIQDYASAAIQELGDRYRTRTSNAPPHVTLQPPFNWQQDQISNLTQCLDDFAKQQSPVSVALSGFSAFAPRVLYMNVLKTPDLLNLQANLAAHLENTLGVVDPKSKQRSFSPHLTVASRNITRSIFKQAWADLEHRQVEFEFVGDRLTLLIHNGQRWQTHTEFSLLKQNLS